MLTVGAAKTTTNRDARIKTTFGICIFRSVLDSFFSSVECLGGTLVCQNLNVQAL